MSDLIISVSGVRGKVGLTLTAELATEYARAFGSFLGGGKVIVGRDSRPSGAMIAHAVMAGLASSGCDPVDIGLAATPTTGLLVRHLGAVGGVEVSASHNTAEWNGLKLFHRDGRVLDAAEGATVRNRFEAKDFVARRWDNVGTPVRHGDPHATHLARVLSAVDAEAIRRRVYHVVLDSNHGVGGILGSRLLGALGCRVTALGGSPDGLFEHPPEPLPENLKTVGQAVRERQAHIGFAQDPDADRLAIIDETGQPIGEENTITLVADHLLAKSPGLVVVNLSTTRAVDEVAARHRSRCERTPVGEANVVAAMLKKKTVVGGEGNGGVIVPHVVYVRDSFVAMALVLEAMAQEDVAISQLVRRLPQYFMIKDKIDVDAKRFHKMLRKLPGLFRKAKSNLSDGVRLDWPDRWVHIRPSNTEPVARIIVEAVSLELATSLAEEIRGALGAALIKPRASRSKASGSRATRRTKRTKAARRAR